MKSLSTGPILDRRMSKADPAIEHWLSINPVLQSKLVTLEQVKANADYKSLFNTRSQKSLTEDPENFIESLTFLENSEQAK